ncbi:MAG: hypothetical protein WCP46_08235 [Alphaproteobacteria bacterium]
MFFNKITRLAILGFSLFAFSYGADDDGRPEYMKLKATVCRGVTRYYNEFTKGYSSFGSHIYPIIEATIPVLKEQSTTGYAFDYSVQRTDLGKLYSGDSSHCESQKISISIISREQRVNPAVVLYLHGSSGLDYPKDFINEVLDRGMAYASFSRFPMVLSRDTGTKKVFTKKKSWNDQTEIPLNAEVMMVYGVCERLVELGTRVIHLAGHSRGGTVTFECAKKFNSQHFRNIVCGDNVGGVVSYTPISAMPVFMERDLTTIERVNIFHGRYDTICSYSLMEYYYRSLRGQTNVQMISGNFGHLPWGAVTTFKGALFRFAYGLWSNKFSPRGLLRTDVNFAKSMWYLVSGRQSFLTWHLLPAADNFNNACVEIEDDNFRPVFPKRGVITTGVTRDISGLSGYLKSMITKGVWSSELPTSASEEQALIARIVDTIAASAAGFSPVVSRAASSSRCDFKNAA